MVVDTLTDICIPMKIVHGLNEYKRQKKKKTDADVGCRVLVTKTRHNKEVRLHLCN